MRVTKEMQNKITREVNKHFAPQIQKITDELESKEKEANKAIDEIARRADQEAKKFIEENFPGFHTRRQSDNIIEKWSVSAPSKYGEYLKISAIRERMERVVEDIVIELQFESGRENFDKTIASALEAALKDNA